MRLTVAICTWNRSGLLRQTLDGLTRAAAPAAASLTVAVVDNASTDDTAAVANEFRDRLPLHYLFEPVPGKSNALNAVLSHAEAEDAIVFTDDDVLVDPAWLVEFVRAAEAFPAAAAVGGTIDPWFPQTPDPSLMEAFPFLRQGFCGLDHGDVPRLLEPREELYGANMAVRVAAIRGMRFDPRLGPTSGAAVVGEESDFVMRLRAKGGTVAWWPAMRVRHYVDPSRMTRDYLIRHSTGRGTTQVLMEPPEQRSPRLFGVPRWLWREYVAARWRSRVAGGASRADASFPFRSGPAPAVGVSPRVRALVWRREEAFLRGMIDGYRRRDMA